MATTTDYAPTLRFMLNELVANTQRISAALPPDAWDEEAPAPLLERCSDGGFVLVSKALEHNDVRAVEDWQEVRPISVTKGAIDDVPIPVGWLQRLIQWLCDRRSDRGG